MSQSALSFEKGLRYITASRWVAAAVQGRRW